MAEGQGGPPKFSPVFYLADLITGYLAAAGMMAALRRRAIEGGSYQVKLSLARSAMWVQELGLLDTAAQAKVPETDSYPAETVSIDTAYGAVTSLAPPLTFTNLTLPATDRLVPYGADPRHGRRRLHEGHRWRRRRAGGAGGRSGDSGGTGGMTVISPSAGTLDEAYERLHVTGPEFDGFLSNHGPMEPRRWSVTAIAT